LSWRTWPGCSRPRFNIDSLVVGRTENPELSRMTIVGTADDNTLEQVRKQLAKLVPVVKVRDFKDAGVIERDPGAGHRRRGPEHRSEVIEIANLFRGKVVDVGQDQPHDRAGRHGGEDRGVH
jgi:acetolactate synthase-1/3 small subunit